MTFTRKELELIEFALQNLHLGKPRELINPETVKRIEKLHNQITPEVAKMKDAERKEEAARGFLCLRTGCNNAVADVGQRCHQHRGLDA